MFVVIFEFVVKSGFEEQFLETWAKTTQGIYVFKGSLGSRLHRDQNGAFIAYAQWPDELAFRNAQSITMSAEYEAYRKSMHDSIHVEETKILHEMNVELDYLQRRRFDI